MSAVTTTRSGGYLDRPSSASLADVINIILDKGIVIDIFVRVSVVGIELITIDARIVIASVDTYLRFAEATNRLDLTQTGGKDLTELTEGMMRGGARGKTGGMIDSVKEAFSRDDDDDDDDGGGRQEEPRRRRPARQERS
jgi:hypothetical protein